MKNIQQQQDKEQRLKNIDTLNEGMQVLREYIYFCNFNFFETCKKYDKENSGSIPEKFLKEILLGAELKDTQFYFTEENFVQIIQQSPINSKTKYVDYARLSEALTNGTKPKNSFYIFRNKMLKQKQGVIKVSDRIFSDEMQRMFQQETQNFFDRKNYFDFKSFDLPKLDVELLASKGANIKFEDKVQEKLAAFFKLNNEIILENFQVQISKKLAHNALPQSSTMYIPEEKMEQAILDFLGAKRGQKMFPNILKDEFTNYIMRLKLPQVELTGDEYDLLYWILWQQTAFGEFSIRSLTKWILENRIKRFKELIKVYQKGEELGATKLSLAIEIPKIFRDLVKVAKNYGVSFIKSALAPFQDAQKNIDLESLKLLLRSLEIGCELSEVNEFKYYCANQGLLVMKDGSSSMGKVQIEQEKFIQELKRHIDDLYKKKEQIQSVDEGLPQTERAFNLLMQEIIRTFLKKVRRKVEIYQNPDLMIDELKLRMVMSEEIDELNNDNFSSIMLQLKHSIEPTVYNPTRKIYLPEFFELFQSKLTINLNLKPISKELKDLSQSEQKRLDKKEDFKQQLSELLPDNYNGVVLKGFGKAIENTKQNKPENLEQIGLFIPKDGKFVNPPEMAFAVKQFDDRKVLETLRVELENYFTNVEQMKNESKYKRAEVACTGLYKHLKGFDHYNKGYLEKEKFIDIIRDMFHSFNWQEVFQIVDFAMVQNQQIYTVKNVSKVDDNDKNPPSISYSFFCLQLSKYYQMSSLLSVVNELQKP